MKLWDVRPSKKVKIKGFDPLMTADIQNRLVDLGFCKNAVVECVRHTQFSGPRVFLVNQTLFALEKALAELVDAEDVLESL